jgi:hypothetical protein
MADKAAISKTLASLSRAEKKFVPYEVLHLHHLSVAPIAASSIVSDFE